MKILSSSFMAGLVMLISSSAMAMPILGFDDASGSQDGTVSYDGSGGALIGSGIDFHEVKGESTPLNDGTVLECVLCVLDFTTGLNTAEGLISGIWNFASGGSFTIKGTVKDGANVVASGTLVSGSFGDSNVLGGGNSLVFLSDGIDTKNTDLLDFYGLGSIIDFEFLTTNLSLGGAVIDSTTGGFTADVTNADFNNTPVPLPAISVLMGLGLVVMGIAGRARKGMSAVC